jgi:hypothetical protein
MLTCHSTAENWSEKKSSLSCSARVPNVNRVGSHISRATSAGTFAAILDEAEARFRGGQFCSDPGKPGD